MSSFFISDIHLTPHSPALTALFTSFMTGPAQQVEHLYILGDLFNTWVGEDIEPEWTESIIDLLLARKKAGKHTYFMPGNRDFLIKESFCKKAGMVLLQDPTVIEIEGRPILLSHGDQYCTSDWAYQRYRRWVHCRMIQSIFLHLPLSIRKNLASRLRKRSQNHIQGLTSSSMDVEPTAIVAALQRYSVDCMIHGHVHRPAVHMHETDSQRVFRYVLGDWGNTGSVICTEGKELRLMQFDPIRGVHIL